MAKTTTLPEHVISNENSEFCMLAKKALDAREQANLASSEEKEHKGQIIDKAIGMRSDEAQKDHIIGKIIISPPGQPAVRVEFRINNGSLDADEMDNLDALFGTARPDLFEKAEIVDKITDPEALCRSLVSAGLNPWDYVELKMRGNQDQILISKGKGITTAEAILPRKGMLSELPGLIKNFSKEAKEYMLAYLDAALKPIVVLGTKVKK